VKQLIIEIAGSICPAGALYPPPLVVVYGIDWPPGHYSQHLSNAHGQRAWHLLGAKRALNSHYSKIIVIYCNLEAIFSIRLYL